MLSDHIQGTTYYMILSICIDSERSKCIVTKNTVVEIWRLGVGWLTAVMDICDPLWTVACRTPHVIVIVMHLYVHVIFCK